MKKSGGISYEKVRDETERDSDTSDNTATDLQDDIIGPNFIEEYRNQVTKKMKDYKYMLILAMYIDSIFQDCEIFFRTEVDLVENVFRLVLHEYFSSFITYELEPGSYSLKDVSESLSTSLQSEYDGYHNAFDIECDDFTMKTKLVVRPGILAIKFDENSFFITIQGFNYGWDYKPYKKHISQKIVNKNAQIIYI